MLALMPGLGNEHDVNDYLDVGFHPEHIKARLHVSFREEDGNLVTAKLAVWFYYG